MRLPGRDGRQVYRVFDEADYLAGGVDARPGEPDAAALPTAIVEDPRSSRALLALAGLLAVTFAVGGVVLANRIGALGGPPAKPRARIAQAGPGSGGGGRSSRPVGQRSSRAHVATGPAVASVKRRASGLERARGGPRSPSTGLGLDGAVGAGDARGFARAAATTDAVSAGSVDSEAGWTPVDRSPTQVSAEQTALREFGFER